MMDNKERPLRRIPKSEKGEKTWKTIFESAQRMFLKNGYHKTSVLSISKDARVSPATFYQYFCSKNEIFEIILESFKNEFFNLLTSVINSDLELEQKISVLINRVFDTFWNFRHEYRVFREAEFIDKKLCRNFHERVKQIIKQKNGIEDENVETDSIFWFVFGPLFYISGYWILWNESCVPQQTREELLKFYLKGLSKRQINEAGNEIDNFSLDSAVFETISEYEIDDENVLNKGEKSKKRLLTSAEKLFGEKGYFDTTIHEICKQSGLGAGSFYLYFPSKHEILKELINKTSKELRFVIKKYSERFIDRRDQEIAALKGFLTFFRRHSNMYGVVREGEFIDTKITLDYYDSLKTPYVRALDKAKKDNQIQEYDSQTLSMILMGIGHLLGQSLLILPGKPVEDDKKFLEPLSTLIMNGFKETN